MLVDLLTQFVGAKMTELKNWSKSLLAEYGFWKKFTKWTWPFTRVTTLFLNLYRVMKPGRDPKQIFIIKMS